MLPQSNRNEAGQFTAEEDLGLPSSGAGSSELSESLCLEGGADRQRKAFWLRSYPCKCPSGFIFPLLGFSFSLCSGGGG